MTAIGHRMILASAGSGKTYALTNRFVRLLALGAAPERIVALTFTRKAAGEFFDEILNKLAHAARDPGYARKLADQIDVPALTQDGFLRMLRRVVDSMHRLRLGTFDGFFARIARNFPFELGLAGEFEVLQEYAARRERSRVLRRMFARTGALADSQKEFIEAFKRATFGADEKRLGTQLDRFLDDHQETFLTATEGDRWGNAERIWPKGSTWLDQQVKFVEESTTLQELLGQRELPEGQRKRWADFFLALPEWSPGAPLPKPVEYLLKNALDDWDNLSAGGAEIIVERKKMKLGAAESKALARIITHLVAEELRRRLEITRGIHAVLRGYESVYHDAVRREGKLTFGDVQRLLMPGRDGAQPLTRLASDETRLFIDFRLDAEIDHWLLDEFQDTSFGQWLVIKNLVDEAVQDPTGARSFFYVGDVKQAIFAWREGDPRLFREIFDQYNSRVAEPVITEEHLVASWRSGPPVIEMVNEVFGDKAVISFLFPGGAAEQWNKEWRDHESAKPELGGQAALLHGADEGERFALALRLLHEIEPLERGLSCALLVQKNDTAARLADYLRREGGLPAVAESDLHVCTDNPLGATMLAMVKAAAYPGDTLAYEHVRMTPLGEVLKSEGVNDPETLTRRVLGEIYTDGFERTMNAWLRRVESRLEPEDAFTKLRSRQLATAAALFDESGSRDVAEFLEFMERYTVRDADTAAVVRVMTIHKAKGLGFDLVILPDLEGTKLDSRRDGLAVQKGADRTVDWVLDLPNKLFAERDPTLAAHVKEAAENACYESLSLLYVAMTRAKRGMYVITKPPGSSKSRNFPKLLGETLGEGESEIAVGKLSLNGAFSKGDGDWFKEEGRPREMPQRQEAITPLDLKTVKRTRRLLSVRPSAGKDTTVPGAQIFSLENNDSSDFGSAVHLLLASIEWLPESGAAEFADSWIESGEAGKEALACLKAAGLAEAWRRPSTPRAEVWREKAFEVVLDGVWVTGVFDRVVVAQDRNGKALSATVYDFKTDWISPTGEAAELVERHAAQLNLYRKVASVLTGLAARDVRCVLIATRVRQSVAVSPEAK